MVKKAIILAGGSGSRLRPFTNILNKHLLLIYNKPMIYYPISTCMLGGIRKYLIVSDKRSLDFYRALLGNGSRLGISIEYATQSSPSGLPEAFIIGEKFINKEAVCLNLGDHILFGSGLSDILKKNFKNFNKSKIFIQKTSHPNEYGVIEFNKQGKPLKIIEKPSRPKSKYIVSGLYLYSSEVVDVAKRLKKSKRNELEITDLNNIFLKKNKLEVEDLGRGIAWFDAGNPDRLLEISTFIKLIEAKQGTVIGCLEEIAYKNKFINQKELFKNIDLYKGSDYGNYLSSLC